LDALAGLPSVAVDYATRVAARVRDLTGGAVDLEPFAIEVSAEPDGLWLRTRGLVRFGRPEIEVYGVAPDDGSAAEAALGRVAAFVAGGGTIEPGRMLGVGASRLVAREGERNRERWGDTVVLELVDVDPSGEPQESGRSLGRREWLLR
jgi:hypothetical protein